MAESRGTTEQAGGHHHGKMLKDLAPAGGLGWMPGSGLELSCLGFKIAQVPGDRPRHMFGQASPALAV